MDNKKRNLNKEYLKRLYSGKDADVLVREFYTKKYKIMGLVFLAGLFLSGLLFYKDMSSRKISEDGIIKRPGYGASSQNIEAFVKREDAEKIPINLIVRHREYSETELSELFERAEKWLAEVMKGENESLKKVESKLYFPDAYEEAPIAIAFSVSDYSLIKSTGEIQNEELEVPSEAVIKAVFSYGKREYSAEYEVTVLPKPLTEEEAFKKKLMQTIESEDERQKSLDTFTLPGEVGGGSVLFRERLSKRFVLIFFLGILCSFLLYVGMDDDLRKKFEKRKDELAFAYPELVSKLALLIGAGMSLTGSIRRIFADDKKRKGPLCEELTIFIHNLDNGILEERAIEDFGRRTGLPQYRKFCSLLSVNLKKGSMNLKAVLEEEAEAAFELHQAQIRKLGEEAGTKLLIPMVLMLAVVIAIIMIPAFLTYQIA